MSTRVPVIHDTPFSDETGVALPTLVAIDRETGEPRFGEEAMGADASTHYLLTSWKLLLGERREDWEVFAVERGDGALLEVLRRFDLLKIAHAYFAFVVERIRVRHNLTAPPQLVVGSPPVADKGKKHWQDRFRKRIRAILKRLGVPKPLFFPEPFAVFQHQRAFGDLESGTGVQNVLVVDVGGGTTDICVVRTKKSGDLARGSENHRPRCVRSRTVGGVDIDRRLARVVSGGDGSEDGILREVARTKERLARRVDAAGHGWIDRDLASIRERVEGTEVELAASDLFDAVADGIWIVLAKELREAIRELRSLDPNRPVERLDAVILSGGTSRMGLLEELYARDIEPLLEVGRYIRGGALQRAVSRGLAVEVDANASYYEKRYSTRPSRIEPYLAEDLQLLVSHAPELEPAHKLRADEGTPVPGEGGVLFPASTGMDELGGRHMRWRFQLRQRPKSVHFAFRRSGDDEGARLNLNLSHVRAPDQRHLPEKRVGLELWTDERGIARVGFVFQRGRDERVPVDAGSIDLHELGEQVRGDAYFGLDFGTATTLCSLVLIRDSEEYEVSEESEALARELESRPREPERVQATNGSSGAVPDRGVQRVDAWLEDEGFELGAGEVRGLHAVVTGGPDPQEPVDPAPVDDPREAALTELLGTTSEKIANRVPAAIVAAELLARFFELRPFDDGSERVAELLARFLLLRAGAPASELGASGASRYRHALERSQFGDLSPLVTLLASPRRDVAAPPVEAPDVEPLPPVDVMLSYVQEDVGAAEELYDRLEAFGARPWMAQRDIRPGEHWRSSILQQIEQTDLFLSLRTERAGAKEGYFQLELGAALDRQGLMPAGRIFVVPVRLEDCEIPRSLHDFQFVDLHQEGGVERLLETVRLAGESKR